MLAYQNQIWNRFCSLMIKTKSRSSLRARRSVNQSRKGDWIEREPPSRILDSWWLIDDIHHRWWWSSEREKRRKRSKKKIIYNDPNPVFAFLTGLVSIIILINQAKLFSFSTAFWYMYIYAQRVCISFILNLAVKVENWKKSSAFPFTSISDMEVSCTGADCTWAMTASPSQHHRTWSCTSPEIHVAKVLVALITTCQIQGQLYLCSWDERKNPLFPYVHVIFNNFMLCPLVNREGLSAFVLVSCTTSCCNPSLIN